MLYSRARSIQGHLVLECARSINFSSLSCVLYLRVRFIRGARSNQGNTVAKTIIVIPEYLELCLL